MWRLMMICVRLTTICCVAEGVVVALSRSSYHDPFALYAAIMPGQPSDNLEHYPCTTYRVDASTMHCTFALKEGAFDSVNVVYDHAIRWIAFTVRPDSLYLGDLILCWGKPTSVTADEPDVSRFETGLIVIQWGRQFSAVIDTARFGHSSPLYRFLP